ncbi:MAG: hypothetical protein EOP54_15090 [Sphingobacteriales bacterium]|nr:MAG: hypothetical protein EOP54_15090 [Sphingobacteriales bacterium]
MEHELCLFKIKLQSLGALRPEAWERIMQLSQQLRITTAKNLVRRPSSLVYVAEGLLKEYDHHEREQPAIINFIGLQQCFVTRRHHQNHYLQACTPCIVYHWDGEALQKLYQDFKELKPVYESLYAEYDEQMMLRMRLLEMSVQERIDAFRLTFKSTIPYLKKTDIANYLNVSYTNLLAKL